jgi:hypothetical protein
MREKFLGRKVMLLGADRKHIVERRYQAAGCQVFCAADATAALDLARHQPLDTAVLLRQGSFLNIAEAVFNLRDLNQGLEIIVLIDRLAKNPSRFFRQLIENPIEKTQFMTRRQLQKHLQVFSSVADPAEP